MKNWLIGMMTVLGSVVLIVLLAAGAGGMNWNLVLTAIICLMALDHVRGMIRTMYRNHQEKKIGRFGRDYYIFCFIVVAILVVLQSARLLKMAAA